MGARPGKCSCHRPLDDGPGNHRLPPSRTPLNNRSTSQEGWARVTAGGGRVFSAMAHLSTSRRAARRRDAIADQMLGMGDHRPAIGRGRMMAVGTFDVCSNAAVNSDLSCFLYTLQRQTEAAVFALLGQLSGVTMVISSRRQKRLFPLPPTALIRHCTLFCGVGVRASGMRATAAVKQKAID